MVERAGAQSALRLQPEFTAVSVNGTLTASLSRRRRSGDRQLPSFELAPRYRQRPTRGDRWRRAFASQAGGVREIVKACEGAS